MNSDKEIEAMEKFLAKLKQDPNYELRQEFGHFLMRHIDTFSPEELKRYNELKKMFTIEQVWLKYNNGCTCDSAYKSRRLTDPNCNFCNSEFEEAMQEYANIVLAQKDKEIDETMIELLKWSIENRFSYSKTHKLYYRKGLYGSYIFYTLPDLIKLFNESNS